MIKKFKLNKLGSVNRGKSKHRPRNDPALYNGKYPFIQTSDVKHSPFYITSHSQSYNEKGLSQSKLWPTGTLCITIAANIADTAILSFPACFPDSIIGFLPNKEITNVKYIKYCLDTFQLQMRSISQGTTQDNMSLQKLLSIEFPAPELETQKKIAAILSAYDDLIENNKRRITLLEKMAEEIYREWFVRFRFPNYKQAEFEKGIPKGWELTPYSEAVNINPIERPNKDIEKPYAGMNKLSTNSMYFKCSEKKRSNSGSKFRNGDTLFPRITPCLENGKRGFVSTLKKDEIGVGSTEFIVMREKLLPPEYIYLLCCFKPFRTHAEMSMVGASGRQRVVQNCFSFFLVPIPPEEILRKFTNIVRPIFKSISHLNNESSCLEKTKNMLLPRLISGKLSVEDLDIQFPPSMQ